MSNFNNDLTIIILAGGYSRRFNHKIKALQEIGGQSLLERRLSSLEKLKSHVIISVSSTEIMKQCITTLLENKNYRPEFTFLIDKNEDQGPMQALYHIIPTLTTKYGLVIGVDNAVIDLADLSQLVDLIKSNPDSDISSVLINKKRLVASFFAFRVLNIKEILVSFAQVATFERLVDLFRMTRKLVIWNTNGEGQFINVNTPTELENIKSKKLVPALTENIYHIEPKYFGKLGATCQSFKNELKSWLLPEIIPHLRDNILKDAKNLLGELYIECGLEEY